MILLRTTDLQDQLQAANQMIADLETQRPGLVRLANRHQDQLQAANQKNVDLENEIENRKTAEIQDQAAYILLLSSFISDLQVVKITLNNAINTF